MRGSLRSPALRALALASGITLLGGASAHAAVDQKVTASKAVAQSCHARNLNGAAGTQSVTATAPDTGLVRARLSGGGDWDLGVFDANSGRFVAGSASFGSNELAEGFVKGGQKLVVQACRFRGERRQRRPVGRLREDRREDHGQGAARRRRARRARTRTPCSRSGSTSPSTATRTPSRSCCTARPT